MSWINERSLKILYTYSKSTIIDLLNSKYLFMKKLFIALKIIVNILLFCFYTLIFIIAWNFIFWLILTILNRDVPWSVDPIHMKMAILIIFLSLLITLLFRKFFYLNLAIKQDKKIVNNLNLNSDKNTENTNQEELEIFINKEIK